MIALNIQESKIFHIARLKSKVMILVFQFANAFLIWNILFIFTYICFPIDQTNRGKEKTLFSNTLPRVLLSFAEGLERYLNVKMGKVLQGRVGESCKQVQIETTKLLVGKYQQRKYHPQKKPIPFQNPYKASKYLYIKTTTKIENKQASNPQQIIPHEFISMTINDIQIINMLYILLLFHIIGCYTCPWQQQPTPNQIKQMKKEQVTQCLQEWVSKGWVDTIEAVQHRLSDEEMESLMSMLRDDVSRLQKLEEQVILGKSVCEPVVKWAQNQTHVMVAVKLSHRWDSPPCTNTLQQTHRLQHHILHYQNICLVSHQQITFQLNLALHNNITSYQLKKDGVGTYSITLSKDTPNIWTHLDKSPTKYPIWEQIMGRNSTIKQQFEKLQEQHSTTQKVEKRQHKSDV